MSTTRGDPPWHSSFTSSRRKAGGEQIRSTLRSLLLIVALNALVSLCISVAVFFVLSRVTGYGTAPAMKPTEAVAGSVAGMVSSTATPVVTLAPPAGASEQNVPDTYIVRSGDNLSEIAVRFGVTLEALMAANGIQNPDWIAVGQKLVIPRPGAPSPTATVPAVPTATETPLPFEPPTPIVTQTATATSLPVAAGLGASSLMTSGPSAEGSLLSGPVIEITEIRNRGSLANEQVVLVNKGQVVDLTGWTLSDKDGHIYTFPTVVLWSGANLRLHTAEGTDTPTDLYWNQSKSIWDGADEVATLKNAKGQVILTYRP